MLLDRKNKNIYGVGISMVFEIFDHFLYQWETGPFRAIKAYIPSDAT
jgi:hypothetical protein